MRRLCVTNISPELHAPDVKVNRDRCRKLLHTDEAGMTEFPHLIFHRSDSTTMVPWKTFIASTHTADSKARQLSLVTLRKGPTGSSTTSTTNTSPEVTYASIFVDIFC